MLPESLLIKPNNEPDGPCNTGVSYIEGVTSVIEISPLEAVRLSKDPSLR